MFIVDKTDGKTTVSLISRSTAFLVAPWTQVQSDLYKSNWGRNVGERKFPLEFCEISALHWATNYDAVDINKS